MNKPQYYDGSALLSQKDKNGLPPEIYMVVTNRNGGKTFFWSRYALRQHIDTGRTFALLIRWNQDLKTRAASFADDVLQKDKRLSGVKLIPEHLGKCAYTITIEGEDKPAVYVLAINDSDKIRENSSLFQRIDCEIFDEFQPETGSYVSDEVTKFRSIHTSIARGGENFVRRVPVIMSSNAISRINPYFVAMGIHKMPIGRAHFLRGDGWVLEQEIVKGAADAVASSGFNKAWVDNSYTAMATQNEYLLDESPFIHREPICGREICILDADGRSFGVWQQQDGHIYITTKKDGSCRLHIAAARAAQNAFTVSADVIFAARMRDAYDKSQVRFSDPDAFAAFMDMYSPTTFA